jgi:membrane dipeptidase
VDGHLDVAWNVMEFGRDPHNSAHQTRLAEAGTRIPDYIGQCTTGFPDWVAGGFGLLFVTTFVMPADQAYPGSRFVYHTPEEAARLGWQVRQYYHTLVDSNPALKLIQTRQDLDELMAERSAGKNSLGLLMLMEGAEPLRDPTELSEWYADGLRILGPAWHATRYAGGTASPGPLTDLGFRLLDVMAALNMVLDLSHIAEEAFYQAVDAYPGPVIASHSNPRAFLPSDRGLSDEMIDQIIARDGVIGVSLFNAHLQPGWQRGDPRPSLSLVAEAIDYIIQRSGSTRHVALGSDMDGGFGLDSIPAELDTCADVGSITGYLEPRGYTPSDIRAILMGNWLRILESSLPA